MCNQGECVWLHLELIGEVLSHCKEVFPSVDYAFTTIPTYPSGQIGFLVCSSTPNGTPVFLRTLAWELGTRRVISPPPLLCAQLPLSLLLRLSRTASAAPTACQPLAVAPWLSTFPCDCKAVLRLPARAPQPELAAQLKYYSSAVHAAAFVLPAFAEQVVSKVRQPALPCVCRCALELCIYECKHACVAGARVRKEQI